MVNSGGPWHPWEHPADWAFRTGRVTAKSREWWRERYDSDPNGVGRTLVELVPVLAGLATLEQRSAQSEQRVDNGLDGFEHLWPPSVRPAALDQRDDFAHLFPPVYLGRHVP